MKRFSHAVFGISKIMDALAGVIVVVLMTLVTVNVILRAAFSSPIKGTFEYVGFLFAIGIGLSIAYCGALNGHIAVTFIVERFHSEKARRWIKVFLDTVTAVLLLFITQQLIIYAAAMSARGDVSHTTKIAYYPFVYIIAAGFFILAVVILTQVFALLFKKEEVS